MTTNGSRNTTDAAQILVGKFFHTTRRCPAGCRIPVWQGHIIGCPAPGVLLIELFEWLMGEPNGQEFITLDDFIAKNPVVWQRRRHALLMRAWRAKP